MFEEVIWFVFGVEDGIENLDLKVLFVSLKNMNLLVMYLFGDMIEVYFGE